MLLSYTYVRRETQQGISLMLTIMMSVFLLIIITVGSSYLSASERSNVKRFTKQGQADNIARAGLQEAVNWFKTQDIQPVRQGGVTPAYDCEDQAFHPKYNSDPLERETIDESYGLVKDIQIDRSIWGRYRVKRQVPCSPAAQDPHAVHDFTVERGKNEDASATSGEGVVWYIESEGIVYRRTNYTKDADGVFTTGPTGPEGENPILDRSRAAIEINRMAILVDRAAATTLSSSNNSSRFNSRCQVLGDSNALSGINYYGGSPSLPDGNGAISVLSGGPKTYNNPNPKLTPERVFSVSKAELKSLSDSIYESVVEMPDKIPMSIVYMQGNFTFNYDKPFVGSGIAFVDGNLNLQDGSNSLYSGVLYVTGRLTVGVNNTLSGAVIANEIRCEPGSGGTSSISYTHNYINDIRQILGTYRENSMSYKTSNG